MKPQRIVPAEVVPDADGVPWSPLYGDRYHPGAGAAAQARHVFLAGNGLPDRWRGRRRFTVLETGFGLGHTFIALHEAWRADPARCDRLDMLSVEKHPVTRDTLARLHADSPSAGLARELIDAWPPLTPDLHVLRFDGGRVRLLLAFGDALDWLPELAASVDAFFLDGFAPDRNPDLWSPSVFKAIARLAAPGATAATWSAARLVREGLSDAGFEVRGAPGTGGKRDITLATYAPRFVPRLLPSSRPGPAHHGAAATDGERRALIVGAGLAGCACAAALATEGWQSRVLDRLPAPAGAASGNPGALFHATVNAQDGPHARFHRAAALHAAGAVRIARERFGTAGAQDGLLRLEKTRDVASMQALLDALGLPPDHVQALDAGAASRVAGLPLTAPAWFWPGGGWVDPRALAAAWLRQAGDAARFDGGIDLAALRRTATRWEVLDGDGRVVDAAPVVVLANSFDAKRLAGARGASWPIGAARGQVTLLPAATPGLRLPAVPLAGDGYVLPPLPSPSGGRALFGATHRPGDVTPHLLDADRDHNLARLARLTGSAPGVEDASEIDGRVGWRCVALDRLPLVGAVPAAEGDALDSAPGARRLRLEQTREVPRAPGLYVLSALGSRGVAAASLGAEGVASMVAGSAGPLGHDLLDAVDPARFIARAVRGRQSTPHLDPANLAGNAMNPDSSAKKRTGPALP